MEVVLYVKRKVINMTIGNKQLEKIVCVACGEIFALHSKRQLIRCLFRIQGTLVGNGIDNKPESLGSDK